MNQKMLDVLAEICENALNDERNKGYLEDVKDDCDNLLSGDISYLNALIDSYFYTDVETVVEENYGDGNPIYHVYSFKEHYIKLSGTYSSWTDTYYNKIEFVEPKQVLVTQYLTKED